MKFFFQCLEISKKQRGGGEKRKENGPRKKATDEHQNCYFTQHLHFWMEILRILNLFSKYQ